MPLDGLLEVTAFHVFYDLAGNFIADTFVVNKTAKAAPLPLSDPK